MLNTLYPPVVTSQPTTQLTPTVLKQQRDGWFRYITAVENNGPSVLENLLNQGRRHGEDNGWPALRSTLDMYLRSATVVIAECNEIRDLEHFNPHNASRRSSDENSKKRGRKADSGVSFSTTGEQQRPSTSGSSAHSKRSVESTLSPTSNSTSPPVIKPSSALERLAREFLRLKPKKNVSAAPIVAVADDTAVAQPGPKKPATLRKMKSLGALSDSKVKDNAKAEKDVPALPRVDKELMKREMERAKREREVITAKERHKSKG